MLKVNRGQKPEVTGSSYKFNPTATLPARFLGAKREGQGGARFGEIFRRYRRADAFINGALELGESLETAVP